jgi:hypothetical protein
MRTRILLTALLTIGLLSAEPDWGWWGSSKNVKENFHYSYPLQPGGRISVDGFNGPIEIISWDKNEVDVSGTKYASSDEILKEIRIEGQAAAGAVRIKATRGEKNRGWFSGGGGVHFIIKVPRKVELEKISTSNGGVKVQDVQGAANVNTSNGSIDVMNLTGGATLGTSNGPIRVENLRGALKADTSNGPIRVRLLDPAPSSEIRLDTSNGPIELTLDKHNGNPIVADSSNGPITLRLPLGTNAQLKASTSNSSVTTEYDVTVRGTAGKNKMEGQIGSGGPAIVLDTSNGPIRILKSAL